MQFNYGKYHTIALGYTVSYIYLFLGYNQLLLFRVEFDHFYGTDLIYSNCTLIRVRLLGCSQENHGGLLYEPVVDDFMAYR